MHNMICVFTLVVLKVIFSTRSYLLNRIFFVLFVMTFILLNSRSKIIIAFKKKRLKS